MWGFAGHPTFRRRARYPGVTSVPVLMLSIHCLDWSAAACSSQGQAVGWCVWVFNAYPTTTTDVQGVHSVPWLSGDTELPHPWGGALGALDFGWHSAASNDHAGIRCSTAWAWAAPNGAGGWQCTSAVRWHITANGAVFTDGALHCFSGNAEFQFAQAF